MIVGSPSLTWCTTMVPLRFATLVTMPHAVAMATRHARGSEHDRRPATTVRPWRPHSTSRRWWATASLAGSGVSSTGRTSCSPIAPGSAQLPDALVHPIALFHVPIQGAGTSITELFELGQASGAGSVGLESYDWEYFRPLREEVDYRVDGGIVSAEPRTTDSGRAVRPSGLLDRAARTRRRTRRPHHQHLALLPERPMTAVGDTHPRLDMPIVDAQRMKTMAAILRDPYPVHWDREATMALGFGGVINQGPLNLSYIANMLMAWQGPTSVRRLTVSFGPPVIDGDAVTAGGVVTAIDASATNATPPATSGSHATATTW